MTSAIPASILAFHVFRHTDPVASLGILRCHIASFVNTLITPAHPPGIKKIEPFPGLMVELRLV